MSPRKPRADTPKGDQATPKKGLRAALFARLLKFAPYRRWYVKRMLKFIDRSKAKGRRLPEGLAETARQLGRVPKQRRAAVLEDAILSESNMSGAGREFRRAAARRRLSTRSDTRYRHGRPPGAGRPPRPR